MIITLNGYPDEDKNLVQDILVCALKKELPLCRIDILEGVTSGDLQFRVISNLLVEHKRN